MVTITVQPATSDRFDDLQHALSGGGEGAGCQCQWWMMRNTDFQAASREERQGMLRDEVAATLPPILLAYVDEEPAAMVRVGPRPTHVRLPRTRAYAATARTDWSDESIWTVSCFVVRREHRGLGLNATLLDAAVDLARHNGARVVEAYPIDTSVTKTPVNDLYHGILSTFENAGFREVARPKPAVAIVELEL